jgi:hypothetical protein
MVLRLELNFGAPPASGAGNLHIVGKAGMTRLVWVRNCIVATKVDIDKEDHCELHGSAHSTSLGRLINASRAIDGAYKPSTALLHRFSSITSPPSRSLLTHSFVLGDLHSLHTLVFARFPRPLVAPVLHYDLSRYIRGCQNRSRQ